MAFHCKEMIGNRNEIKFDQTVGWYLKIKID